MTANVTTSPRFTERKDLGTKKPQRRVHPLIEELEDRVVLSYFPATTSSIAIFEDQLPGGLSSAMLNFVATHTDGTQKELLSQTNQIRAINPNFTVLHYQLGTGNSAYDYIINDQWASDFSYVNQQESWFAHQSYSGEPQSAADLASGRVLGNNEDWYQADISNPAWQQYTLSQVFQNMAATASNGWFADSYTYGIGGAGYDSPIPLRYQGTNAANPAYWPNGVTWTTQLGNWATTIENAFAQHNATYGTNYKFIPNLGDLTTSWEPNWYDNSSGVPFIDGAFLEGFGESTDTYDWTLSMNRGLNLTDNGKIVIMEPYLTASPNSAAGQQQVNFLLGTYLLLKGNQTYLNIDYGGGVQYYPQYQLNLGTPTTPLQSNVSGYLWDGVYRRDFQNGFVLVNPGSVTNTLNLGGTYQEVQGTGGGTMTDAQINANGNYIGGSLTYQKVGSITLAGGSAAIFFNPTSTASFIKQDTTTQGNWIGTYGTQGYDVIGNAANLPSYATITPTGQTYDTWTASTTDSRALQDASGSGRIAACWYSSSSFTVNVNLTDGQVHDLELYFLDWDSTARSEQVQITNASTGAVLDTETVSSFHSGVYLAWAVSGNVNITISHIAGANAVLSALFLNSTTPVTASYLSTNSTTQGNWIGTYGTQGYDVIGNAASPPSYATITPTGQTYDTWTASTTDSRALQDASGSGRIAACWYSSSSFTVNVNLTDGQVHDLELYFLDWDSTARSEQVQITNASTGAVLDTKTVSSFHSGVYLAWAVSGNVNITITHTAGANAVLSGLFLDPT